MFKIKHTSFEQAYPFKCEMRKHKINDLRAQYDWVQEQKPFLRENKNNTSSVTKI